MKTIKIFIASSEELDTDRMVLGNLVRRLDNLYEKRGIRIKLFEWEDYDAAFNDRRKQDEYNDYVRQSDVFIALFHKKAGKFTLEEFDVATEEFKKHVSPKIYMYCKNLQPDEVESSELIEFKKRIIEEMGHYWCRYDNRESLQLHIVMQLQLVENSQSDTLKVEDGNITIDGLRIAPMDKLQFAAANEDYIKAQQELHELRDEIDEMQLDLEKKQQKLERKKAKLEADPDDEDLQEEFQELTEEVEKMTDRLQPKLNKYNKLKEEFEEYQNLLFNTAKRVARLQGERVTERMRRAMDAFNEGKVREANIILDEAEADARRNLEDYKQSKEITELKRQTVISSIEELLLKTSTIMADSTLPIEERIERTEKIYAQADEMAAETDYDREKYVRLLLDYANFLGKYALYPRALQVYERLIKMCEELYGMEHPDTATAYNNIGIVYTHTSKYKKALECCKKALAIRKKVHDKEHPRIASSLNNVGFVYCEMGDFPKALEYYKKALAIREKVLGNEHPDVATSYNNIGLLFHEMGDCSKALEYSQKALVIRKKILGKEHPRTATSINNLGAVYGDMGDYPQALEYYKNALNIWEKVLGKEHPNTATAYSNIGVTFHEMGDYYKALEYHDISLTIRKKVFKEEHPDIARTIYKIGLVLYDMGNFPKALESYLEALDLYEKTWEGIHQDIIDIWNNISEAYRAVEDYSGALKYRLKLLDYHISHSGEATKDTLIAYNNVGAEYRDLKQFDKALEYLGKAYDIAETIGDNQLKAALHNRLGRTYAAMGDSETARAKFQAAIDLLPENHPKAIDSRERLSKL